MPWSSGSRTILAGGVGGSPAGGRRRANRQSGRVESARKWHLALVCNLAFLSIRILGPLLFKRTEPRALAMLVTVRRRTMSNSVPVVTARICPRLESTNIWVRFAIAALSPRIEPLRFQTRQPRRTIFSWQRTISCFPSLPHHTLPPQRFLL